MNSKFKFNTLFLVLFFWGGKVVCTFVFWGVKFEGIFHRPDGTVLSVVHHPSSPVCAQYVVFIFLGAPTTFCTTLRGAPFPFPSSTPCRGAEFRDQMAPYPPKPGLFPQATFSRTHIAPVSSIFFSMYAGGRELRCSANITERERSRHK